MPPPTPLPPYQTGPSLTILTVVAGSFANSVWTPQATYSLLREIVDFDLQHRVTTRNMKPSTVFGMNMVPVEAGTFGSLRCLKRTDEGAKLRSIATFRHCIVTGVKSHDRRDVIFVITNHGDPYSGIEEQYETLDLEPVALIDTDQDVYTFVA